MTTSSTSITIKWANSKLAEALRKREEEEAMLRGKGSKVKDDKSHEQSAPRRAKWTRDPGVQAPKSQRWAAPVDLTKPSPLRERPRTESGATTFHFAVSQVSKETSPTVGGKPVAGYDMSKENPGADHELYIGRELAAELEERGFDAYVARPEAVEIDSSVLEREPGGAYNEAVGDGFDGLDIALDARGAPSIFSNISDDPFERAEFWKAVHRSEREARVQELRINAVKDRALVEAMTRDEALPASLREVASLAIADADAPREDGAKPLRPRVWNGDAEGCGRVLARVQTYDGFNPKGGGIAYRSGRGGTVQHRLVAELPHELSAAERAALVRRFCEHLERLEEDENGEPKGVMYTAAIHAPDAHNDARNYHLHVVFHDRPAKMNAAMGMWDFEVAEVFERKGEIRTRYPLRQNKLRMVRGFEDGMDPEASGRNFIPGLRRTFSQITNEALERAGIERRYDPRTYKAMGIERTPTDHLGTSAAALEAAGVETTVGSLNAQKIWGDAEREIAKRGAQRRAAIEKREEILKALMAEAAGKPGSLRVLGEMRGVVAEWGRIARDVMEDRALVDGFDLMEAKARSRAEKVRDTCLQTLADIERGTAAKREVRAKRQIEQRYADAAKWLAQIDAALEPGRADIQQARTEIAHSEDRAAALDQRIDELARDLRVAIDERAAEAAKPAPSRKGAPNHEGHVEVTGMDVLDDVPGEAERPPARSGARPVPDNRTPDQSGGNTRKQSASPASGTKADRQTTAAHDTAAAGVALPRKGDTTPEATNAPPTIEPAQRKVSDARPSEAHSPAAPRPDTPAQTTDTPSISTPAAQAPSPDGKGQQPSVVTPENAAGESKTATGRAFPADNQTAGPDASTPSNGNDRATPGQGNESAGEKPVTAPDISAHLSGEADKRAPVTHGKGSAGAPSPTDQPALFDLPEQAAPAKAGSIAERQKAWDAAFRRIDSETLFILPENPAKATPLIVPRLTKEEQAVLADPDMVRRTQARLAAMKKYQDMAVERLDTWLKANGHDETKIRVEDRKAEPVGAPKAVRTLLAKYRLHPDIKPRLEAVMEIQDDIRFATNWLSKDGRNPAKLALSDGKAVIAESEERMREAMRRVGQYDAVRTALRQEYRRREEEREAARLAAQEQARTSAGAAAGSSQTDEHALVPTKGIKHPWVRDFVAGLNRKIEPEAMHELAKKIEAVPKAREELHALGQQVGVAWTRAVNQRPDSKAPAQTRDTGRDF